WCKTCQQYQPAFEALATQFPQACLIWIDIEEQPELLGDEDIEDFPTLLIQNENGTVFYGPMLPHIEHLERLVHKIGRASCRGRMKVSKVDVVINKKKKIDRRESI